jgi:CHASE2 domain-containing sensor protein
LQYQHNQNKQIMDIKPIDSAEQQPAKAQAKQHHKLTIAAFVATVLAWVTLPLHYLVSICICVIGLAMAIIGIRQPRGGSRNLALVTTVAAGVLLLVYAIFWAAMLFIALKY